MARYSRGRKTLIKWAVVLFLVIGFTWVFREFLFQRFFCYKMTRVRDLNAGFNRQEPVTSLIKNEGDGMENSADVTGMIGYVLEFTDKHLAFSTRDTKIEPDDLLKHSKANCVGYAAFFKAVMDVIIESKGIKSVEVYHVVGKVHFFGVDLHSFTRSPVLRDHDYVIVVDLGERKTYFVDPSLHDFASIRFVRGDRQDNWPNNSLLPTTERLR